MHLSTEDPAAALMLELFGEVGGDVPEYFLSDFFPPLRNGSGSCSMYSVVVMGFPSN